MKAGWTQTKLATVLKPTLTVNPAASPNDKFQYVDVSAVSTTTHTITESQTLIGRDAPSRARKQICENDVLFATIRPTLHRIAIVQRNLSGQVCSTGYVVLRPTSALNTRFLFYWLFSHEFSAEMKKRQRGASYPAVSDSDVKGQMIRIPPVKEQERIVAILDIAFEQIKRATEVAIATTKCAGALFEAELTSRFDALPSESKMVKLAELATDIVDGDHMPPPKTVDGVPFVTISNIDKASHQLDLSDTFFVSRDYFEKLKDNRKPRRGDLLYTVTGSFGIPVVVEDDLEFCFQRHIGLIRPKVGVMAKWLYYLIRSPHLVSQAEAGATGTAQRTVSLTVLRNFKAPCVTLEQQKAMTAFLDDMQEATNRLTAVQHRKLAALAALKQSLLHQAFSGNL